MSTARPTLPPAPGESAGPATAAGYLRSMLGSQVRSALEALGVRGGRLLVAASGGLDSTVLLALLGEEAEPLALELVVGHVHHQLRGSDADDDARWLRDRVRAMGLAFEQREVDPLRMREGRSSRDRPTLEEAARVGRRQALEAMAVERDCHWIATAHHADDQAETVMLRILRGTGPEGLAAMGPRSRDGRWVRPLLGVERERLRAWAVSRALEWREDASNRDRGFARNRLRLDWLPELAGSFNPRLLRTLCHLAEAQRRDLEWIETLVEQAAAEWILEVGPSGVVLAIDGWSSLPEALARRLVRRVLIEVGLGRSLSRRHLERVLDVLRRGRRVGRDKTLELPRGARLRRITDAFVVQPGRPGASERNGFEADGNATLGAED